MTLSRMLSLALAAALANLIRAYWSKWKAHKAARTEIPAYRNWRGEYVPDLHLLRARRMVIAAWVAFAVFAILVSLYQLGGEEMRAMLDRHST